MKAVRKSLAIALAILLAVSILSASVLYPRADQTGEEDSTSWSAYLARDEATLLGMLNGGTIRVGATSSSSASEPVVLSLPESGQIYYPTESWFASFAPWTKKEAVVPAFIDLANKYGGTYESIGKSSSPYEWDIVLFKFGNPKGAPLMIDSYVHGNEFYGEEALYALMKWLLTSGDSEAERILANNYVLVVPVVNYRWARTNYNVPSWMTATDPGDEKKCGVNLNRNFDPNWPSWGSHSSSSSYSGAYADSEQESKALINAWAKYKPLVYWSLHQGASPKIFCKAATLAEEAYANEILSILLPIQESVGVTGRGWTFFASTWWGGGLTHGKAASMGALGFVTEIKSGWDNSAAKRLDLTSGATFKQVKAMFIAMAAAID